MERKNRREAQAQSLDISPRQDTPMAESASSHKTCSGCICQRIVFVTGNLHFAEHLQTALRNFSEMVRVKQLISLLATVVAADIHSKARYLEACIRDTVSNFPC